MSPLGTPQSQQSSESTRCSQSPSLFADSQSGGNATVHGNPAWQLAQHNPLDLNNYGMGQYFDLGNPDQQEFWYQDETAGTKAARRTRKCNDQPAYVFLARIEKVQYLPEMDRDEAVIRVFDEMANPSKGKTDHGSIRDRGMYLDMLAMKNIK